MIPQTDEPALQFVTILIEGAIHEDPWTKIHHVGMELIDKRVEIVKEVRNPVDQPFRHNIR